MTTHDGTQTSPVDEPSLRGFEGHERMRLVRDQITTRVRAQLTPQESATPCAPPPRPPSARRRWSPRG